MATYYLNVNATDNGNGTKTSPFNVWSSFGNAMYENGPHNGSVACGTEVTGTNLALAPGGDGWVLTSYGEGERPLIHCSITTNTDDWVIHDVNFDGVGVNPSYIIAGDGVNRNASLYNIAVTNKAFMTMAAGGGGFKIHDFTVNCKTSAMNFEATSTNKFGNTEIYNFTIDCNGSGSSDGLSIHISDDAQTGGTGWDVHNGTIKNCGENCLDLTACGGGQFYQLDLYGARMPTVLLGYQTTGVHVHHNRIHDGTGNGEVCDNSIGPNYVYKNFIRSTGTRTVYITDYGAGTKTNFFFEGNTIVADGGESFIFRFSLENGGTITATNIKNNIITTSNGTLPLCFAFYTGFAWNAEGLTCENNHYYNPAGAPVMASGVTWAAWNGTHTENGSADPLLVDRTLQTNADYRDAFLNSTESPVLNAGSYTTNGTYYKRDGTAVTGLHNVDDFVGTSANGTLDIGFFEYVTGESPPVPPSVTTSAVSSVTETTATGNGTISAIGDTAPSIVGVHVSTTESLVGEIAGSPFTENGTYSTEAFDIDITGLTAATTYYCQAYATSDDGTGTGDWVSFQTSTPPGALASGLQFNNALINWS